MLRNRVEALEKAMPDAEFAQFIWVRFLAAPGREQEMRACKCLGMQFERGNEETEEEFRQRVQTFARAQPKVPASSVLIAFEDLGAPLAVPA